MSAFDCRVCLRSFKTVNGLVSHLKAIHGRTLNAFFIGNLKSREALIIEQNGRCAYCGDNLDNNSTIDHVVPRARGGSDDDCNLVAACPDCNRAKGAMLPSQLRALADRIEELCGLQPKLRSVA